MLHRLSSSCLDLSMPSVKALYSLVDLESLSGLANLVIKQLLTFLLDTVLATSLRDTF